MYSNKTEEPKIMKNAEAKNQTPIENKIVSQSLLFTTITSLL
ncbi:hypothetical protein BCSJ1_00150 [Bacillus cereus SJ1]|nr:hypothetical protein BCSJ1_00150 [Bacillus cereus SJ1]